MGKGIAVYAKKGGVGKTVVSANLSAGLAISKIKCLHIDADSQANSKRILSGYFEDGEINCRPLDDAILGKCAVKECIAEANEFLDVMFVADNEDINDAYHDANINTRVKHRGDDYVNLLANALADIENEYQYIIFDLHPSIGWWEASILDYVDGITVPVQLEYSAVDGIGTTYQSLKSYDIPTTKINAYVPNMLNKTMNEHKNLLSTLQNQLGKTNKLTEVIPKSTIIMECNSKARTVWETNAYQLQKTFSTVIVKVVQNIG